MIYNIETYFHNAKNFYERCCSTYSDCAVLSVLCHPNYIAPLTDEQESQHVVVSFVQSATKEYSQVHAFLKAVGATSIRA